MPNATTATSSFTITAKTRSFQLDPQGKGVCSFTVANSGKAALEGRVRLAPSGTNPAVVDWLSIAEPTEQAYKPNEERTYSVAITVPEKTPGGTYVFRAEAYSVANPNDDYVGGPEFSFTIAGEPPPSPPFRWWIPISAVTLVIAIAALVFALWPSDKANAPTKVPELVGKSEDEATKILVDARLALGGIERKPTAEVPAGQILGQSPVAGEQAEPSSPVSLIIADEVTTPLITVPELIGKTQAAAQAAIIAAKLKPGVVGEDPDAPGAVGVVLKQSPAAGQTLGEGSEVSLVVKGQPVPTGPGPISWHGSFRVRQTWFGDVDTAKECDAATRNNADFWFQAVTASERYLVPQNGAALGFPSEPTLTSCREAIAAAPLPKISLASLKPDKLIAIRTNLGHYALLSLAQPVAGSPATLELRYVRFVIKVLPVRPAIDIKAIRVRPTAEIKTLQPVQPTTSVLVKPAVIRPAPAPEPAPVKQPLKPVLRNDVIR